MTALQDPPPLEPEVLIEEARRRQRRRRRALLWAVVPPAAAALVYGASSGGGPPSRARPTERGGTPVGAPTASWHQLSAPNGYIQPGAQITSLIRWHGELIAAGGIQGSARLRGRGCGNHCNPVVWISKNGRRWRAVFAGATIGSLQQVDLAAVGNALLLFNSHEETQVWRSTDGHSWRQVQLPKGMDGMPTLSVAANGRRVVVSFSTRFPAGPGGRVNPVWTSTDGLRWHRGYASRPLNFKSVAAAPHGFVAVASNSDQTRSFAMSSSNGLSWTSVPVNVPGDAETAVAAGSAGVVIESSYRGTVEFQSSANGRRWIPVTGPHAGSLRTLLETRLGFIAFGATNNWVAFSGDGRHWTHLRAAGTPPSLLDLPTAVATDGDSLLVLETAQRNSHGLPAGATTLWQLKLR